MSQKRSPVLGYNHNILHLGWALHIQTEDSGVQNPHIFTHLFHNGTILASKKLVYDVSSASEFVRDLMQAQHKAVLREVKNGVHDDHIRKMLGEPPAASGKSEASPVSDEKQDDKPDEKQDGKAAAREQESAPSDAAPSSSKISTTESTPPGHAAVWSDNVSLPPQAKALLNSTQLEWNDGPQAATPPPPSTPPAQAPRAPTPPPSTPPAQSVRAPTPPPSTPPAQSMRAPTPAPSPLPARPIPSTPPTTTERVATPPPPSVSTPPAPAAGASPESSHTTVDVGSSWVLRGRVREEVFPAARQPDPQRSNTPAAMKRTTTNTNRPATATRTSPSGNGRAEANVTFPTGKELLESHFPAGECGGITLDRDFMDLQLGQEVTLKLRVETLGALGFELKGRVAWKRPKTSGALRAGVGVEFLPQEKIVVERLIQLAEGAGPDATDRRHARVMAELGIKLTHKSTTRKERAGDISEGGLFIRTDDLIAIGEEVVLTLKPPRALIGSFDVRGKVTWHRDEAPRGFGVMFLFNSPAQKGRVEELLDKLSED